MARGSESETAPGVGRGTRWLVHGCLLAAFAAVGGALLVWPQWIAREGSRTAVQIQREREQDLADRLETTRAMNGRLREWSKSGRRVFLPEEVQQFAGHAQAVADREGAVLLGVKAAEQVSPRWSGMAAQADAWVEGETPAGEIRPVSFRLSVAGKFDAVYRTVVSLCGGARLVVPDTWELQPRAVPRAPATDELRADLLLTVFVVREAEEEEEELPEATESTAPMLAAMPPEGTQ
jgi:hypothetical protein